MKTLVTYHDTSHEENSSHGEIQPRQSLVFQLSWIFHTDYKHTVTIEELNPIPALLELVTIGPPPGHPNLDHRPQAHPQEGKTSPSKTHPRKPTHKSFTLSTPPPTHASRKATQPRSAPLPPPLPPRVPSLRFPKQVLSRKARPSRRV